MALQWLTDRHELLNCPKLGAHRKPMSYWPKPAHPTIAQQATRRTAHHLKYSA